MRFFPGLVRFQRRVMRWAVVFLLLAGLVTPVFAQAASGIQVSANTAVLQPQKVVFTFQVSSPEVIDAVTIIYGYTGHGCDAEGTRKVLSITRGKQVHVRWEKDFASEGGLLSGAELWWQFEVEDKAGEKHLTDRQTLLLMDTSIHWNTLEEGKISLFWYEGSQPFGERLMGYASGSLQRLEKDAGIKPSGQIRIVIYPSTAAMRAVLGYSNGWAGGVTFGEYDLVLAGISPVDDIGWAQEVILHELTHVITETGFINCQAVRLPLWLVEGIAEYIEEPVSISEQEMVLTRLEDDTLPALKEMRHNFPYEVEEALLAYAQSKMVVAYMIETHGAENMNRLVEDIRTGKTIDQALRFIYGLNTAELDQTWRAEMGFGAAPEPNFITETPAPTRTPIATLELHPSWWTPGPTPTRTLAATPTITATLPPTATLPATRTPIPTGKIAQSPTPGASAAQPAGDPWLLLGGGVIFAISLVTGIGIWAVKKVR